MIMPSKTVKPIDSLVNISSYIIQVLLEKKLTIDEILDYVNKKHYKTISIEKLLLCLDFLYMIDKIEIKNEAIKIKF